MKTIFDEFDRRDFFENTHIHAFYCNQKNVSYHNHRFFELVYVISGRAIHKIDTDVREITVGDYMFMDYSTFHEYKALTDDFAVINCLFLSKVIDNTLHDCVDFQQLLQSYHLRLNKIIMQEDLVNRFFKDTEGTIKTALLKMCEECEKKQTGHIDYMRSLLIQIIIETVRSISVDVKENYSEAIMKTVKMIEENSFDKIKLTDIASRMFISVPYLSSKFKEETGVCFSDYLKQVRIQKACVMLKNTDFKVHTIAEKVGYSDYKRFGSIFKDVTGTSPIKYRISNRQ